MSTQNNFSKDEEKGLIFLIQRYSIHDGPGIRTTVFMKGCPLGCLWCQNPESFHVFPELMTHDIRCISCGECAKICPKAAISLNNQLGRKIDRSLCNNCFDCVDVCPTGALSRVGEYMTIKEVTEEIEKDTLFYDHSGGGVTVSGGEPLLQSSFVFNLLKACKEMGFHTALDTSGYGDWPAMEKVLSQVDLVLFDLKHVDPNKHHEGTGKGNKLIFENLRKISPKNRVWLRLPLIPGYNDSQDNLRKIGDLAKEIGAEKLSLLPVNQLGEEKCRALGRTLAMEKIVTPADESIQAVKKFLEDMGLDVTVGE